MNKYIINLDVFPITSDQRQPDLPPGIDKSGMAGLSMVSGVAMVSDGSKSGIVLPNM